MKFPAALLLIGAFMEGCVTRTVSQPSALLDAERTIRHAFVQRDTQVVDLAAVGRQLVSKYGQDIAWKAVLEIWNEQTGQAPIAHASDPMWLVNRPAHVQCAAWMIHFKSEWMTPAKAMAFPPAPPQVESIAGAKDGPVNGIVLTTNILNLTYPPGAETNYWNLEKSTDCVHWVTVAKNLKGIPSGSCTFTKDPTVPSVYFRVRPHAKKE